MLTVLMNMSLSDPILCQQGHCAKESSINDKNDWETISDAFSAIDFTKHDLEVWVLRAELPIRSGIEMTILLSWSLHSRVTSFSK